MEILGSGGGVTARVLDLDHRQTRVDEVGAGMHAGVLLPAVTGTP